MTTLHPEVEAMMADETEAEAWPERQDEPTELIPLDWAAWYGRLHAEEKNKPFVAETFVRFVDPVDGVNSMGQVWQRHPNGWQITVMVKLKLVETDAVSMFTGEPITGLARDLPVVLDVRRTRVVIDQSAELSRVTAEAEAEEDDTVLTPPGSWVCATGWKRLSEPPSPSETPIKIYDAPRHEIVEHEVESTTHLNQVGLEMAGLAQKRRRFPTIDDDEQPHRDGHWWSRMFREHN